jgi:hypothetical protein
LRAAGEGIIRRGRQSETFQAIELSPKVAGKLMHDALARFRRRRMLLGPTVRPPAAILYRYKLRVDGRLADYVAEGAVTRYSRSCHVALATTRRERASQ